MGRTNQLRHRCETIIRTGVAHVAGAATAMSYAEAGIEEYTYLATLDIKTSEICHSLDQKTFPLDEKQEGVNYLPMHPNCRSTTYFSITKNSHSMRAARDPATGKSIEVPENWDYGKWYEERVVKGNAKTYQSDDDWQETVYGKKSGKKKNDIFEEFFKNTTPKRDGEKVTRNIDVDDLQIMASSNNISEEVAEVIGNTVNRCGTCTTAASM